VKEGPKKAEEDRPRGQIGTFTRLIAVFFLLLVSVPVATFLVVQRPDLEIFEFLVVLWFFVFMPIWVAIAVMIQPALAGKAHEKESDRRAKHPRWFIGVNLIVFSPIGFFVEGLLVQTILRSDWTELSLLHIPAVILFFLPIGMVALGIKMIVSRKSS
jgi:hypothetical protein